LVEETGVPGENHRTATSNWQTLSHSAVSSTPHLSKERKRNLTFTILNPSSKAAGISLLLNKICNV
jgi:hypothetical protein